MENKNMRMARQIALAVEKGGGRAYYVGGLVRDRLRGVQTKDIDLEVHGIAPGALRELLTKLGEVTAMGASFGILGLKGYDLDIAMPRREHANGRGHKDFDIFVDPYLGPKKAALRRDFTINAMMEDILTGQILDFFGGRDDLAEGIIRHVNDSTFAEDPLRVLRGAQFAARFGYTVAPETVRLSSTMDLKALPAERIFGELEKAMLRARRPSVFFEVLRGMGQLNDWFPELDALIGVAQDLDHHPEGDVWIHTMQVLDHAGQLRGESTDAMAFMLSALMHDLGKPAVTTIGSDGRIHSYGHAAAGEKAAAKLLQRITNEKRLIRYVRNMVSLHMEPNRLADRQAERTALMCLFDEAVCPEDLLLLARADRMGRVKEETLERNGRFLEKALLQYRELMARPYVQGRDLVAAGIAPGPVFSEALAYAHRLRLEGIEKDSALRRTLSHMKEKSK